jgi:hypothetical protein
VATSRFVGRGASGRSSSAMVIGRTAQMLPAMRQSAYVARLTVQLA